MSTPIVINDKELAKLREYAEQNPLSLEEVKKIISGEMPAPGDRDGYCLYLPPCWKLVYSIGVYPRISEGTCVMRHMSISLSKPGRYPNLTTAQIICESLGFPKLNECHISSQDGILEVLAEVKPKTEAKS